MPKIASSLAKTLTQIGLSEKEAVVYEALLSLGKVNMGKLLPKTPYKRGNTYDILKDLTHKGLVTETEERGKKVFMVEPPDRFKILLEEQEKLIQQQDRILKTSFNSIASAYRLAMNKPGVRFFEGLDGIKEVLEDTLIDNKEKKLLTFSDVAGYAKYLKDWNTNYYAPKRKKLQIFEKVIIPDNAQALDYMKGYQANELTEIIFIDHTLYPFATEINIYENKASFVTFSEKNHVGVIVENNEIYSMLASIFNFCWALGNKYCQDKQPDWLKIQMKKITPLSASN
ncbi:MAG: helix-turn-helix domain-containing protein [Patescibacteria group bacterium]|jgi:sugar-specific transcriptional regulator TrmB